MIFYRRRSVVLWLWLMQPTLHVWSQGVAYILVGHCDIKPFWIETPTTPPFGIGVFGVCFVGHKIVPHRVV